ncbi:hypothetical protein [Paenisporosarcina sp. TG20]|uniref:hypothetical protein n=1 Tax=Paenisporosarcina sp. TG20 TaxID=1211706 RepID=UPI0002E1F604|nr:hypothetical protein [Paenisporosarcina sp. TG20]
MGNNQNKQGTYTKSGTNIEEVKRNNAHSGLTYNEIEQLIAEKIGRQDAEIASEQDFTNLKKKN